MAQNKESQKSLEELVDNVMKVKKEALEGFIKWHLIAGNCTDKNQRVDELSKWTNQFEKYIESASKWKEAYSNESSPEKKINLLKNELMAQSTTVNAIHSCIQGSSIRNEATCKLAHHDQPEAPKMRR